MDLQSTELPK